MPLKQMSYDSADKIIDIYSTLLINIGHLKGYKKYGYSDLKGYDIVDVSNAIKLMIAYRFFNDGRENTSKLEEIKEYVSVSEAALSAFSFHFFPDGVAHELGQIDPSDLQEAVLEKIRLTKGSENYEWNKIIRPQETTSSFFTFCQTIRNKDPDFWEKVYSRIGITWESNNWKDRIYFIIKHKDYFVESKNDENCLDSLELSKKKVKKSSSLLKYLKDKLLKFVK